MRLCRSARTILATKQLAGLSLLLVLWGCVAVAPIDVAPVVQATGMSKRFDGDALVLMSAADQQWTSSGNSASMVGVGISLQMPLGRVLKDASIDLYGKAFRSVRLIQSPSEAPAGSLVIHPKIESFSWSGGFTGDSATVTASVSATVDGNEVFRRVYQKEEPAPLGLVAGSNVGPAATKAIVSELVQSLDDMRSNTQIQAWLETGGKAAAPRRVAQRAGAGAAAGFPRNTLKLDFPKVAKNPDDIAVIIGNGDYAQFGSGIPDVAPAYSDSEAFKLYALRGLGVREGNIIFMRDATGAQMVRVFGNDRDPHGQLYDWVRPGRSRVTVYYAGHGAPAGANGTAYLVPVDADAARIELNGYPLETLYKNLAKLPAKSVTVILESCFSGVSQGGAVVTRASSIYVRARVPEVPAKLTVITAGQADQVASWEEDKSHGLFTEYYLKGMAGAADKKPYGDGNGRVSLAELQSYFADTLTYYARRYYGRDQTPEIIAGGHLMD